VKKLPLRVTRASTTRIAKVIGNAVLISIRLSP
jgi:hypothetical protein